MELILQASSFQHLPSSCWPRPGDISAVSLYLSSLNCHHPQLHSVRSWMIEEPHSLLLVPLIYQHVPSSTERQDHRKDQNRDAFIISVMRMMMVVSLRDSHYPLPTVIPHSLCCVFHLWSCKTIFWTLRVTNDPVAPQRGATRPTQCLHAHRQSLQPLLHISIWAFKSCMW